MPAIEPAPVLTLSHAQVQQFIGDGFVRVKQAFPRELAKEGRAIHAFDGTPARHALP
jgi:hypothetical protein